MALAAELLDKVILQNKPHRRPVGDEDPRNSPRYGYEAREKAEAAPKTFETV